MSYTPGFHNLRLSGFDRLVKQDNLVALLIQQGLTFHIRGNSNKAQAIYRLTDLFFSAAPNERFFDNLSH